jgi:hypothetical protein
MRDGETNIIVYLKFIGIIIDKKKENIIKITNNMIIGTRVNNLIC